MYTLTLRYGTLVATNTAVLCLHVRIVCLPVLAPPGECYHNILLCCDYVFVVECGIVHFLCAMDVSEVQALSSSPRLPLCQILFLSRPAPLSWPMEKNSALNHSITQLVLNPAYLMRRVPKLALRNNVQPHNNAF